VSVEVLMVKTSVTVGIPPMVVGTPVRVVITMAEIGAAKTNDVGEASLAKILIFFVLHPFRNSLGIRECGLAHYSSGADQMKE
jgi:hypothetical protein